MVAIVLAVWKQCRSLNITAASQQQLCTRTTSLTHKNGSERWLRDPQVSYDRNDGETKSFLPLCPSK